MRFNKKAQSAIDGLQNLIVPLVAVGIVLIVAFLIFAETRTQTIEQGIDTATYVNETVTIVNNTEVALTHGPASMSLTCTAVFNNSLTGTASTLLDAANYTCTRRGITMVIADPGAPINLSANGVSVSYTIVNTSLAFNATEEVQNATQDIPGWLPIIVITVIGALLLGLVAMFRKGR